MAAERWTIKGRRWPGCMRRWPSPPSASRNQRVRVILGADEESGFGCVALLLQE